MIGQIINYRYEVLEKIGDGPFFSVYKARDKVLNRLVALKVLSRAMDVPNEFAREVVEGYQNVASLAHPGIARVLDAACTADECYIACEFARGVSIRERVHRAGAISAPLAIDIAISALEAMEYSHANGVIHGDLRAEDIIVSPDGEVKVTDFGLRGALDKHPEVAGKYDMHSARYQAPEIDEGAQPAAASDTYSMGIVMYEMLTGTFPFDGQTAVAIALRKLKEPPRSPRSLNTAIPNTLNEIVLKSLDKDPMNRYRSAAGMLADLRALRDSLRLGKPVETAKTTVVKPLERVEEPVETVDEPIKKRYVTLMLLFVGVVILSLFVTLLLSGQKAGIEVPSLLGKTWDEALYEAQEKGIKLEDDGRVYSEAYEAGQICSVIPPAGSKVPRDNPMVRVKISKGPSLVEIPDLEGMYEAEANQAVTEKGFAVGRVKEEYSEKVPVNQVISQTPSAGLMRSPGTEINLVISLGPKPEEEIEGEQTGPTDSSVERKHNVAVEVSDRVEGPQEVKIVVNDDRGETISYLRTHQPGEDFTATVTTYGSSARIRVYVGGSIVSDSVY